MNPRCNEKLLQRYVSNRLSLDDKLQFLFHLDDCRCCRAVLLELAKAQHPHYYRKVSRPVKALPTEVMEEVA